MDLRGFGGLLGVSIRPGAYLCLPYSCRSKSAPVSPWRRQSTFATSRTASSSEHRPRASSSRRAKAIQPLGHLVLGGGSGSRWHLRLPSLGKSGEVVADESA